MLDYKESFAYAEFWRTEVAPYLQHLTEGSVGFGDYLYAFYKGDSARKAFGIPLPYIYTLDFLRKYNKHCVTFMYNSPEEVSKGAAPISTIHQFSPCLHGTTHVYMWREDGTSDGHVAVFLIYEKFDDVLSFIQDNLSLVKKPKVVQKGFATIKE